MALSNEEREHIARIADSLEGIEMLLAMWLEKSMPAGEIWVEEGPSASMARRTWRTDRETERRAGSAPEELGDGLCQSERGRALLREAVVRLLSDVENLRHVEERLVQQVAELETRLHEDVE